MHSIYIDSGDEVTTVIERLREAPEATVALVAPKGAVLLQSVVNLKLVRKAAQDSEKSFVIVSTDPVGTNLCTQLGIPVAKSEAGAEKALADGAPAVSTPPVETEDVPVIAGVRIHNYYDEPENVIVPAEPVEEALAADEPSPIIIPKELLEEKPAEEAAVVAPTEAPALTRQTIAEAPVPVEPVTEPLRRVPKERVPVTPIQKRVIQLTLYLAGVGVLALSTIAFLFLPFTTVTLVVKATPWTHTFNLAADSTSAGTSADNKTIPAEKVSATADTVLTFNATGTKDKGTPATGTVTFYNYDSTAAVTVPAGTTITSGALKFTTDAAVSVPGFTQAGGGAPRVPGKKDAAITASAAGPSSNLSAASASDIKVGGVSLTSLTVTTTGGTSQTVAVISAQDIATAKEAVIKQLTDSAIAKLADQLKDRDVRSKEGGDTVTPGDVTISAPAGTEAATATATASVTISRVVISNKNLTAALQSLLLKEQRDDRTYAMQDPVITLGDFNSDKTTLAISVVETGKEAAIIAKEALAQSLGGKSLSEGEALLHAAAPGAEIRITNAPSWWPIKRYPTYNRYITVDVKYE